MFRLFNRQHFYRQQERKIDLFGKRLLRAASISEEELASHTSLPFQFARLKTRILFQERKTGGVAAWLMATRSAMSLVFVLTILVTGLFIIFRTSVNEPRLQPSLAVEALLDPREMKNEPIVFSESSPITGNEVLLTIVTRDGDGGGEEK